MTAPIASGGRAVNPAVGYLATINRWVCWKLETRKGKLTKPPYQVGGHRNASSTDPATWDTFDACWRSAFVDGAAAGIGIVLVEDDPDHLMAGDIDNCVDAEGEVAPWAQQAVRMLYSYTERSPFGRGLRVFFLGTMPDKGRKVRFQDGHLELYRAERYLTVTGDHLPGTPLDIRAVEPAVIAELLGPQENDQPRENGADRPPAPEISDDLRDRLNEALAEDSVLWAAWNGEAPAGADQTRSAFDLKLAGALQRHGGFTLQDFATLARWWDFGKGKDGDPRHCRRAWDAAKPSETARPAATPITTIGSPDLLQMQIPPREIFLDPWIAAQSISMVFASRGTGKTFFLLSTALALAAGDKFLGWRASVPRKVAYVEGELPLASLQDRCRMLGSHYNLTIVNPELQPDLYLPHLATEQAQELFDPIVAAHDVLILDSLATLAPCSFDKDSENWAQLQPWFLAIRRRGKALVFAHHTKSGRHAARHFGT